MYTIPSFPCLVFSPYLVYIYLYCICINQYDLFYVRSLVDTRLLTFLSTHYKY